MQENNFEKKVQEKMSRFSLAPSPAAWDAVAARIRKQKKRRFIFFWMILFLAAGGAGVAVWYFTGQEDQKQRAHYTVKGNENPQNYMDSSFENKKTAIPDKNKEVDQKAFIEEKTGNKNPVEIQQDKQGANRKTIYQVKKNSREANRILPLTIRKNQPNTAGEDDASGKQKPTGAVTEQPATATVEVSKPVIVKADSAALKQDPVVLLRDQPVDSMKDVTSLAKKQETGKSRWSLAFSVGRSSIIRGFHLFNNKTHMEALASQLSNFSPGGGLGRRSYLKPSFSFSAGIFYRQTLSPRLDLKTGFNYRYLSTRMHAGSRVDSTATIYNSYSNGVVVNKFYRPSLNTDEADYTNQFHFFGLSAELSWKLTGKEKNKLVWNNGLSYNRLLASNMLHFDYASRLYYNDNHRLNKNQLFFNSSVDIPIGKNLTVSPFISTSITSVFIRKDTVHRFTNYGLQLNIPINKKRKQR